MKLTRPPITAAPNALVGCRPQAAGLLTRRRFLKISAGLLAGSGALAAGYYSTRDRIRLGLIGCGYRGSTMAEIAKLSGYYLWRYGSVVALADVNRTSGRDKSATSFAPPPTSTRIIPVSWAATTWTRSSLRRPTTGTPRSPSQALRAGKAVFHEKPFSHTIQESQVLRAAVKAAGLPFLVGTHQRSMWSCRTAAELVRNGRLGKVAKATVVLFNKGWRGGPFFSQPAPDGLDWDRWLGPAAEVAYCPGALREVSRLVGLWRRRDDELGRRTTWTSPCGQWTSYTPARSMSPAPPCCLRFAADMTFRPISAPAGLRRRRDDRNPDHRGAGPSLGNPLRGREGNAVGRSRQPGGARRRGTPLKTLAA